MKFFSYMREKRESRIRNFLNESAANEGVSRFYWQPPLLVIIKIVLVLSLFYKIFTYHEISGELLSKGFEFFKLAKIFNFKFPEKLFFERSAIGLYILLFAYPIIGFLLNQTEALLSSLVLNRKGRKLIYLKNNAYKKELFIFPLDEIRAVNLKEIFLISRLFNTGTIRIMTNSDDEIRISSIGRARSLISQISMGLKGNYK